MNLTPPLYERLAKRFTALGHPARLQMLHHLLAHGPTCVTDLTRITGLAQPSVSKHLGTLAESNLIRGTRQGARVLYEVVDPSVATICKICCDQMREEILALSDSVGGE